MVLMWGGYEMAVDKLILPEGYVNEFTILETEIAIKKIKDLFFKVLYFAATNQFIF